MLDGMNAWRSSTLRYRIIASAALSWALVGASIAVMALSEVSADARLLVGMASVVGPAAALLASVAAIRSRRVLPSVLLVVSSIITPTYFAWTLNLAALVGGLVLLAPMSVDDQRVVT